MDPTAAIAATDGNSPLPAPRADRQGGMKNVQMPANQQPPPRKPEPDEKLQAFTKKWLERLEDVPDFKMALKAGEFCQQTLFPAWWDPSDPYKGRQPSNKKTREDDRRVNTPLAYLNVMQTVAMTCPQEHRAKWMPDEEVPADDGSKSPMAKFNRRFGRTIEVVSNKYLREIGIQDILEACVQDSATFPIGVLKVFFSREMATDPISETGEHDEQDNVARVQEIGEDLARGEVQQTDPRLIELRNLLEGMGGKSEVELWEGLVVENLQMSRFKVAPEVTCLENLYQAPWMSNDIDMTVSEIRQKFPFSMTVDKDGKETWTGVHPEDLAAAITADSGGKSKRGGRMKPRPDTAADAGKRFLPGSSGADFDDKTLAKKLVVTEVWAKCDQKVYVFIPGVPYPVHQWTPVRGPAQWYQYVVIVPNRLFGSVYGVSDVELQADEQSRINRKGSDEEKARWDSLPRNFYNSSFMDEKQAKQMTNPPPFSWTPIALGAEGFKNHTFTTTFQYDVNAFEASQNRRNLQRAALLPEQATGVTGSAQFAEEVKVAAQGSSIAARFRQNRITRALERFYDVVAQILLQEVSAEQAKDLAGEHAIWPKIYSDREAKAQYAAMQQEIRTQLYQQVLKEAPVDTATGMPQIPPMDVLRPQLEEKMHALVEQKCLDLYGFPEPLTREALYRRLRVKVSVAIDGQIDRERRMQGVLKVFEGIATASQAALQSGLRLNLLPLLRQLVTMVGADEDLYEEMFGADAGQAAAQLVEALQAGQQIDPAAAQQVMMALQQAIAPMLAAQAAAGGAPGGAAAGPNAGGAAGSRPASPQPAGGAAASDVPGVAQPAQPPPGLGTGPQLVG